MVSHLVFFLFFGGLGLVTLVTFFFSVSKPSRFTKNLFWILILPAAGFLIALIAKALKLSNVSIDDLRILLLITPPLPVLLMSLSGTRVLVDHCPPMFGIPISLLNALGCIGLTFGLAWLFSLGAISHNGEAPAYVAIFGGGAAAVITLIFAIVVWKKRLASKIHETV